jgi:hypothetical protein
MKLVGAAAVLLLLLALVVSYEVAAGNWLSFR